MSSELTTKCTRSRPKNDPRTTAAAPLNVLCTEIYSGLGKHADAIQAFARSGDRGSLGYAYAAAGREREARELLAQLEQSSAESYVAPYSFALVHVGLGNKVAALDFLERGYATRDVAMSGVKVDPRFASLAGEPRFRALLAKMGLQ